MGRGTGPSGSDVAAPLNVSKNISKDQPKDSVWRWTCRVPNCGADDWESQHAGAITAAHGHLQQHARFGFRGQR